MRKHMNWLMWITVVLITVTFLFFGIYPSNIGGGSVAKVDDHVITKDDFLKAYRNTYELYRQIMKDQFTEAMAKELRVQTIREMVSDRLLIKEAERVGLKVSDEELQNAILKEPAFSREGKFDQKRYERALSSINVTPALFEASQREALLRQKIVRLVRDGVSVTDTELAQAYKQRNPKAKPAEFEKNKETFRQTYLAQQQRETLNAFIRTLYDRSNVKIDEKMLAS